MNELIVRWYDIGVYLALIIAAAAFIWVFYDSQQRMAADSTIWRVLTLIGAILILPSLYLKITVNPFELLGALAASLFAGALAGVLGNLVLFGYIGMAGLLLSLGAAIFYYARGREAGLGGGGWSQSTEIASVTVSPPEPTHVSVTSAAPAPPPISATKVLTDDTPAMGWLAVRKGAQSGRQFKLGSGRNGIGRDGATCSIVLDDDAASKQHAQVNYENGQFYLYDMASTNGTFINDQRWQKRQLLYDDDEIRIGDTRLVFKRVKGAR